MDLTLFKNILFSSDLHIGHANIIRYCSRPFKDVDEMTEVLVANHNALVGAEDLVIDVGDFSMQPRHVQPTLLRMNGKRILVSGNHDQCHPVNKGWEKSREKYLSWGFSEVVVSMNMEIAGEDVIITHMPYEPDPRHPGKYAKFCPEDKGGWLIHGQEPGKWKEKGKMIDVGVDARDYRPIHIDEIARIINGEVR